MQCATTVSEILACERCDFADELLENSNERVHACLMEILALVELLAVRV